MTIPASRRERLVMGLSIAALLLLVANVATFLKQHFFESESIAYIEAEAPGAYFFSAASGQDFVVSGMGNGLHVLETHRHEHQGRLAWHIQKRDDGNTSWTLHQDDFDLELAELDSEMAELERHLADAESRLDWASEELEVASEELEVAWEKLSVEESKDADGRRTYRIKVRSSDRN